MTPCEEYWEALNALVDGECTPEEEAALRAHLATCEGCRTALAELEALQAVCEDWAGEPDDFTDAEFIDEADVPEGFAQRVLARAAEMPQIRGEKKARKSRSRGWAAWASLAACLGITVLLGTFFLRSHSASFANSAAPASTDSVSGMSAGAAESSVSAQSAGKNDSSKRMTDEDVLTAAADLCWELTAEEEQELLTDYGCGWQETEAGRVYTLTAEELEGIREKARREDILLSLPWAKEAVQDNNGVMGPCSAAGASDPAWEYEAAGTPEKDVYRILVLPPEDE